MFSNLKSIVKTLKILKIKPRIRLNSVWVSLNYDRVLRRRRNELILLRLINFIKLKHEY